MNTLFHNLAAHRDGEVCGGGNPGDPDYELDEIWLRSTANAFGDDPANVVRFDISDIAAREEIFSIDTSSLSLDDFRLPFPATLMGYWFRQEWIDVMLNDVSGQSAIFVESGMMVEQPLPIVSSIFVQPDPAQHDHPPSYVGAMVYSPGRQKWVFHLSANSKAIAAQNSSETRMVVFSETLMKPVITAIHLLNCRNVITEPVPMSRQRRRWFQQRNQSVSPEYRIVVNVPGKKSHTLAGPRRPGEQPLPAHMVRGHFAEYTEDKPLFGKYAGRFWIPSHVRGVGDAEPKDYVVRKVDAA